MTIVMIMRCMGVELVLFSTLGSFAVPFDVRFGYAGNRIVWGMLHLICTQGTPWLDDDGYSFWGVLRFLGFSIET